MNWRGVAGTAAGPWIAASRSSEIERVLLPPSEWLTGAAAVNEVPYEESAASRARVEPADLAALPPSNRVTKAGAVLEGKFFVAVPGRW